MQIITLISILMAALIYLHINQSRLIYQPAIKASKIVLIVAMLLVAAQTAISTMVIAGGTEPLLFAILSELAAWIFVIVAYSKFLSGCYRYASIKKNDSVLPQLRKKVTEILQSVIDKGNSTPDYQMFL